MGVKNNGNLIMSWWDSIIIELEHGKYCINVGGYYYYANFSSSMWDDRLSLYWTVQMSMVLRHRVQCSCYRWCSEETLRRSKRFWTSMPSSSMSYQVVNIFSISYIYLSFILIIQLPHKCILCMCSLCHMARQLWMKVVSLIFYNDDDNFHYF